MSIAHKYDKQLEPILAAVRRAEKFLGPDDDWVEEDHRIFSEAAQRLLGRFHTFVYHTGEDDYVATADVSPDEFERLLMRTYQRNLLSGRKYRTHHGGGKQWAVGSFVLDPISTRWQHHVYIFPTKDGRTDIYAHKETSVRQGSQHLSDELHRANERNLFELLYDSGIDYRERTFE